MRDKNYYEKHSIWHLKSIVIFAFNIDEAAEFVAKIQCLEGNLEKSVPDEPDQYYIDNPILLPMLKEEIADYKNAIISGINKETLKTLYVKRDIYDEIICTDTYIEIDDLESWFAARDVAISGDFLVTYQNQRMDIYFAAIETIVTEEYKLRYKYTSAPNRSQSTDLSAKDEKIFRLEMELFALEKKLSSIGDKTQSSKDLETRERDTLLKIILGMAIKGYSYNPDKLRNDAIPDIVNDLLELQIPVSDDTIRKKLKEASSFLPPQDD